MSDSVSPERIMQTGFGFFAAKTLLSAVELDLFTELEGEVLNVAELEERLGLHERSSKDFLDTLVSLGFLERDEGRYRNSPEASSFLVAGKPAYLGGLLKMANDRLYPYWGDLTEALQTGKPQNEIKHENVENHFFDTIYSDDQLLLEFVSAMSGLSSGIAVELAEEFPWSDYDSLCDIGTSEGMVPVTIASQHEHLEATGFDLPKVEKHFNEFVEGSGVEDRVQFQPGNFFEDSLPTSDVLIMGHILHDWGLDEKQMLLEKAHQALPEDGALIVYGTVIDSERRENTFGLLMSLNMLIETPDGFDYTFEDCMEWMNEAGFSRTWSQSLAGPASMVVAEK